MKKAFALAFAFILVFAPLLVGSVYAEDNNKATLDIEYEKKSDGNILVKASLNDIRAKNGISTLEYDILYNAKDLKFVNATVNVPDKWKPYVEDELVEILSQKKKDGVYYWAAVATEVNIGIKDDNQLFIVLEFKPLTDKTTDIKFEYVEVGTDYSYVSPSDNKTYYDFASVQVNAAKISIDLKGDEEPSIETSDVSTNLLPPIDSFSREDSSLQTSGVNNPNGTVSMPGVNANMSEDVQDKTFDSTWIIFISIILVVAVSIVLFILFLKKDSKVDKNV